MFRLGMGAYANRSFLRCSYFEIRHLHSGVYAPIPKQFDSLFRMLFWLLTPNSYILMLRCARRGDEGQFKNFIRFPSGNYPSV